MISVFFLMFSHFRPNVMGKGLIEQMQLIKYHQEEKDSM